MYPVEYLKVDWHQAHQLVNQFNNAAYWTSPYNSSCYSNGCCNNSCNGYYCNRVPAVTPYIYKYVYKQQVYYVRYENGKYMNWSPLIVNDDCVYFNHHNNSLISTSITDKLLGAQPLMDIPVVYPDYSKVDVGKGKTWPQKVFSPYVDSTAWPPFMIADIFPVTTVPYYNLGFIVSQSANLCKPTWGTYYSGESGPLNDQIKKLRELGGDVTVSFGGAANVPLHITAPDSNTLFKQYQLFTDAYGLTRIDFDIEGMWGSASYRNDNIKNSAALKLLQDYYKAKSESIAIWFTLPILPSGLTEDGLNILRYALAAGVEISGVNAMAMDYGDGAAPSPAGKMGMYGIQAITSLKNQLNVLYNGSKTEAQLWAMIGITPMIGVNDVATEIFTLQDATQVLNFCQTKNVGEISMWSSNRDKSSASGIPQSDNAFSILFNAYNNNG